MVSVPKELMLCLDDQIGNGIHGGLQPGGQADTDDIVQHSGVKTDPPSVTACRNPPSASGGGKGP